MLSMSFITSMKCWQRAEWSITSVGSDLCCQCLHSDRDSSLETGFWVLERFSFSGKKWHHVQKFKITTASGFKPTTCCFLRISIYSDEGKLKKKKPVFVDQRAGWWTVTVLGLAELHLPAVSWLKPRRKIQHCSETRLALCSPGDLTQTTDRQQPEKSMFSCSHKHIFEPEFTATSLTQVLRVDERYSSLRARPSTSHGSSAANLVVKLATGDVHLMQGWGQALGQHAGAVGVKVEAAFVASDGLVHAALVALALVVRLTDTKVNSLLETESDQERQTFRFWAPYSLSLHVPQTEWQQFGPAACDRCGPFAARGGWGSSVRRSKQWGRPRRYPSPLLRHRSTPACWSLPDEICVLPKTQERQRKQVGN